MANNTTNAGNQMSPSLPALLGRLQIILVVIAAVILSAVVAAHGLIFLWHVPNLGLVALLNQAGPAIGLLLMTLASYLNYYGTWRVARRKDKYDVHEDLKSHAADIPYALSRLGCTSILSTMLLAAALVATGLTYAPQPFGFLGIDNPTTQVKPTPTPTPRPTPTPVPTLSVALSTAQASWDCNTDGRAIAQVGLTLDNSASNVTASWTATPREMMVGLSSPIPWAAVNPNQGRMPAGQTQTLALTPTSSDCLDASPAGTPYHLDVALDGGAAGRSTLTFTYTITGLRRVAFKLNPTQYPATGSWYCPPTPPAVAITLDNMGSNVDVGWKVTMRETIPSTTTHWATVDLSQGTVSAGKTSQITLTPNPRTCAYSASWHADVSLTSGGSGTQTFTYTTATIG